MERNWKEVSVQINFGIFFSHFSVLFLPEYNMTSSPWHRFRSQTTSTLDVSSPELTQHSPPFPGDIFLEMFLSWSEWSIESVTFFSDYFTFYLRALSLGKEPWRDNPQYLLTFVYVGWDANWLLFQQSCHKPNYQYVLIHIQSNLSIRTPLYYGQFSMSRQNSHIFSLKKTSIIRTRSNTDNGH